MTSRDRTTSAQFEEGLAQIGRYKDFSTIDWVKDAILERYRQSLLHSQNKNDHSWSAWWQMTYEGAQSWIVISLIGAAIGLNSALIAIITSWLSDIKLGYCSNAWWLNQKFCCWELDEEHDACEYWRHWSEVVGLGPDVFVVKWFFYILWATTFAATCAYLVKKFAPYAAGSGISEIKCILGNAVDKCEGIDMVLVAGFVMKGFLGGRTLAMKSIGLTMAVASNLSIGKEGPSVHMACCVGNVIARSFDKFRSSKAELREVLTASSAAGVAVAFGSPIGGVLFALEEMSTTFPNRTMWKSFFCAMIATMALQAMNPFRTGKLVMFQVTYDREWHFFEYLFVLVIGVFGGLYGALVIKFNLIVAQLRKRFLKHYPISEAAVLAFITAIIAYPNVFLRIDMTEIMGILFRECEGIEGENYHGLCQSSQVARLVFLLFLATLLRMAGTIITYGVRVPCGIFVPSMAVGATFGRMVGLLAKAWQASYPNFFLFSTCPPDVPCITPGTYAFLGAAAALCGVMRITVSVVVIMFELTGQITYILPTMITLMVTRAVGDWFSFGGIADRYIRLNGYPFLDKEDHVFGVPVSHVMQRKLTVITSKGMKVGDINAILKDTLYQGFPVVSDYQNMTLVGFIGRSELTYLLDRARQLHAAHEGTECEFLPGPDEANSPLSDDQEVFTGSSDALDFGPYIDQTPITMHPKIHLETVMDMFKQLGPRVILLEQRGRLHGLVTVKDVLQYMEQTDNDATSDDSLDATSAFIHRFTSWIRGSRFGDYARLNRYSTEEHELNTTRS